MGFFGMFDSRQTTPLHMAIEEDRGRDALALITGGADIEARDIDGETPLFGAIHHRRTEIVHVLLRAGADIEARNGNDYTPLMSAANSSWREAGAEAVRTLISYGADVHAADKTGVTAMHLAAGIGNAEL